MRSAAFDTLTQRRGAYLHFPWCVKKCPYCDFNSHAAPGYLPERDYMAALCADLGDALSDHPGPIASVFCGGGTPSLFSAEAFARLLALIRPHLTAGAEVTMEANPGTLEHRDLAPYRKAGINRLSFGAQSFNATHLKALGRIHDPADIAASYRRARLGGFTNINLDLMYGLPTQTPDQAVDDLRQAITLEPTHISWYQLTIEPKTEFARTRPNLASESSVAEMEARGVALLAQSGYRRYEVSAFARDGYHCRHNVNYWEFGDYLGVGAGAHGKVSHAGKALRTRKPPQPRRYMAAPTQTEVVPIDDRDLTAEFMLNALRLSQGVSFERYTEATGRDAQTLEPTWRELVGAGLVEAHRIKATTFGYRFLDSIIARFLV